MAKEILSNFDRISPRCGFWDSFIFSHPPPASRDFGLNISIFFGNLHWRKPIPVREGVFNRGTMVKNVHDIGEINNKKISEPANFGVKVIILYS